MHGCRTQRTQIIYTRFLWFAAAAYSTSAGYWTLFSFVIHALRIYFREDNSFICLLLLLDIIDCYNYGEIHFKENRSFIFYGLILMGTWIIRTKYYTFDHIL
jgi:hypothetical protein